ncbi:MAG: hypothetical protein IJ112_07235, partial [Oscillospiraceae bacterium]|nr:hypothetical protein [Oscillospiraceae bacterium]
LRYTGSALMTVFFSQHLQLNAKRSTSQVLLDLTGAFSVARYFATRPWLLLMLFYSEPKG